MVQIRKTISGFLLCLFLIVNGHNAIYHSHIEVEEEETVSWQSLHQHTHEHAHHHHSEHSSPSFFHWLQQLIEDFKHADLGDKHFEVYLHSGNQVLPKKMLTHHSLPFFSFLQETFLCPVRVYSKNSLPYRIFSCADPPFLDLINYRGPPVFS